MKTRGTLSPFLCVGVLLLAGAAHGFFPAIPWLTIPASFINQPLYLANPPIFATGVSTESAIAYGAFKLAYFYDQSAAAAPVTAPPGPANLPGAVTQPTTDVGPGDPIGQAASVVGGGGGASGGAGKRRRREAYVRRYSPSQ